MLVVCVPPRTRMMSGPGLLPRVICGAMDLLQPGSMLTFMTHVATKAMEMPRV